MKTHDNDDNNDFGRDNTTSNKHIDITTNVYNNTDNHHNTSFVAVRELAAVTETARASRRTIINTCNSNDNNSITIISRVMLALTFMIIEPPRGSGRRGR